VLSAFAEPGDAILGLDLAHGGHLTHGMKLNFSGKIYRPIAYHVDADTGLVDMDEVRSLARRRQPAVLIAGWSAYPRHLDFAAFREVADEVGATLWVDMAHFAGLVAAGLHPSPIPFADVVTTTTHKTLGGPRSALILCRDQHAKRIDSNVFPGQQGGPLMHAIAAKAVTLKLADTPEFRDRQLRTLQGAQTLAHRLLEPDATRAGIAAVSGGTDVHLVLVDLRNSALTGRGAEDALHDVGITVNRNAVPGDPRPPMITSGLRIGTAALATRGFGADDFAEVADLVAEVLTGAVDPEDARLRVKALTAAHPLCCEVVHARGARSILMGRYQVVERIGKGGMGTVWSGLDVTLDRSVAVKVMRDLNPDKEPDPTLLERFHREARVAAMSSRIAEAARVSHDGAQHRRNQPRLSCDGSLGAVDAAGSPTGTLSYPKSSSRIAAESSSRHASNKSSVVITGSVCAARNSGRP
jgi:glycine hydroxymethyltransferase